MKKSKNNSISDWLDKHGDPEIRKQVEEEAIRLTKEEEYNKLLEEAKILDCRYDFTSKCVIGRCDCKPKN